MSNMDNISAECTYKELTPGGLVYGSGNSEQFHTGSWRTNKPIWNEEKCTQCMLCYPVCPDISIPYVDGKRGDFDYDHCKGCGICAAVCAPKAITMVKEEA